MDRSYDRFARMGLRNIDSYNEKVSLEERLPYIVLIVDELAALISSTACRGRKLHLPFGAVGTRNGHSSYRNATTLCRYYLGDCQGRYLHRLWCGLVRWIPTRS
ncbi:hypothetical protein [Chthonomonas calidirosea]|uniref:hypothetical protein n=1 Tax=Chthonomonas calidirosea TaxID=454171 RepID=UPI00039AD2E3|nr:hypothetical protein [Chthonomonas calidirosea]